MHGVGVIGCGAISKLHLKSYEELDGVEIKAVADANIESARRTGIEYKVDYYNDYMDVIKRDDVKTVSICTPSGRHEIIAIEAARHGKNIIVEKPLEVTVEKIDNMIKACEENRVKLACIFNNRYREGNVFIKRAIENGRFGKLINVNAYIRWYRDPDYYLKSDWRGTWELDGGGALMNQSIHYIDLLQWFAGSVDSINAYTGTLLHKTIQTEDTAVAILKYKSGALGAVVAGTSIYPGYSAIIEVTGERGSASISDGMITGWNFKDMDICDKESLSFISEKVDNKRSSDPMAFDHKYHKIQLEQVINALELGIEPNVNGQEAKKPVELILAAYKSAGEGMEIRL